MPDFSSFEKSDAISPLSEYPFAHLPHIFLLKPLLILGKAMHYYGLRPDDEAHFLVPKPEFERLWAAIPEGHSDGLELQHEIDRTREMSLLAVVHSQTA